MLIHEFEQLLRSGRRKDVERQLLSLNLSKIPRDEMLSIANIASRINKFDIALRILNPIVRQTASGSGEARDEEKIEYANCLRKLGAVSEAAAILERIDSVKHPSVNFYRALCCFASWEYESALPFLRSYLATCEHGSYAMKVGQINYASALITSGEFKEAQDLLSSIYESTKESESRVLCANSLELRSQIEILHNYNPKAALALLTEARYWLGDDTGHIANLFVRKWEAVAISQIEQAVSKKVYEVRETALKLNHWETARDCEYFIAELTKDSRLLTKLYYSTPYEAFRRKIRERNPELIFPDTYVLGTTDGPFFDLRTGEGDAECGEMKSGQMPHKLLILLARDLYKPTPLLAVFSGLFPNEYANPFTSPNRVHQIVRSLRIELERINLPIEVVQNAGGYTLEFRGPAKLCLPRKQLRLDTQELNWLQLQLKMKSTEFTNKDAVAAIGSSRASIQRLLGWAVQTGRAEPLAGGRSARYKLVS